MSCSSRLTFCPFPPPFFFYFWPVKDPFSFLDNLDPRSPLPQQPSAYNFPPPPTLHTRTFIGLYPSLPLINFIRAWLFYFSCLGSPQMVKKVVLYREPLFLVVSPPLGKYFRLSLTPPVIKGDLVLCRRKLMTLWGKLLCGFHNLFSPLPLFSMLSFFRSSPSLSSHIFYFFKPSGRSVVSPFFPCVLSRCKKSVLHFPFFSCI